ncbi:hypothetical protein NPIL_16701 [Nephila pilipes]|uniref:Uncharacterized protein n=1 Tax=Nephila pilipes TaxID=299642 RepID=A0A8X6MPK2_NEPPI|nr:hypothetical protein NPIL_16701 [Nephila pilipes]
MLFDAAVGRVVNSVQQNNEIPNLPQTMESFVFEWQLGTITFKIQQIKESNSVCYSLGHHGDMDGDHLRTALKSFLLTTLLRLVKDFTRFYTIIIWAARRTIVEMQQMCVGPKTYKEFW